jgi:hypothetical protein
MARSSWLFPSFACLTLLSACAAIGGGDDDDSSSDSTANASGGSTASGFLPTSGSGQGTACDSGADDDADLDGFTVAAGDCNDCDANINPQAVEVIASDGPASDENCNGQVDEPPPICDSGLAIGDLDPMKAAAAMDLCQGADAGWGVVDARYLRANGQPASPGLSAGILEGFGSQVPPRHGERMLALSSGHARSVSQAGACGSLTCETSGPGSAPPGFPQDVPSCPGDTAINDDVAFELSLRAPSNATGYAFDFTFYSFEYPEWVCTEYNDQFIALVEPPPQGSIAGNVSFDSMKNPVSVNIALFEVCPGCAQGTGPLQGTGFDSWDDAGATGWLVTQAPVTGGETFAIRFAIWDTGDQALDSTVLIDNFQWIANAGSVAVGTQPVPK